MAGWRRAIELAMGEEEDVAALEPICRSRLEPASRVARARIRLSYRKDPSGREPTISAEAEAKNSVVRTHCGRRAFSPAMGASMGRQRGIPALPGWLQCTLSKILNEQEIKAHKVRYD
jgi:hypothetical protein